MEADAPARLTAARGRWIAGSLSVAAVLLLAAAVLVQSGTPLATVGWYLAFLLWGVVLPGFIVHRSARGPQQAWPHDIALGAATGFVLLVVPTTIAVATGVGNALWIWPVLTLALLIPSRTRGRVLARPAGDAWGAGASIGVGASTAAIILHIDRSFFAVTPLPPSDVALYQDLLWHLGLIGEAMRSIPLGTPQAVTAGPLRYHWFANAEIAGESLISGIDPSLLLLRLWPLALSALAVTLTAVIAHSLSKRSPAAPLAAALAASTMFFIPWVEAAGPHDAFRPLSPSQLFGMIPLLLGLHSAFAWSRPDRRPGDAVVLALSLTVAAGTKPTLLPLLLAGCVIAATASAILRRPVWPMLAAAAATAALLVGSLLFVSGGDAGTGISLFASLTLFAAFRETSSHGGSLDPAGLLSSSGRLAAGVTFAALWAVRPLLGTGALFQSNLRRRPEAWMISGACGAGVLAFLVLGHPGFSQLYFLYTAFPLGAIAGAWWLVTAIADRPWAARTAVVAGIVGAIIATGSYWWGTARHASGWSPESVLRSAALAGVVLLAASVSVAVVETVRHRRGGVGDGPAIVIALSLTIGAIIASLPYTALMRDAPPAAATSIAAAQAEAGRWIARNTPTDALLAVNDHCLGDETVECDARTFWASGLGQRRVLVEAWTYTPQSGHGAFFDPQLLTFNQSLFERPTEALLDEAAAQGVGWLVATEGATPVSPRLHELADLVYTNDSIAIFRLRQTAE
ncbi:hypothetical protein HF576_08610 [Microbacterium sp. CFH 90308]|uniref:Glycosyltransferase RgtA/B/C/D-like domain-containing protein n=1 Tax=Microbacterium salsuginis TaxID=2722803 RepID=A0ABX1KA63_9MICO|nr:hypothetical protein [Microbacterium sp. CFH 90308]NLP83907.1 hypothetical protein [Microbacterium sp. CFH 90308]